MGKASSNVNTINEMKTNELLFNNNTLNNNDVGKKRKKRSSCGKTCGKPKLSTIEADFRAELLVRKFNAPQCRLFFLKCIYHLPESEIQDAIDRAMRPDVESHIRYFTVVAKRKLALAGY